MKNARFFLNVAQVNYYSTRKTVAKVFKKAFLNRGMSFLTTPLKKTATYVVPSLAGALVGVAGSVGVRTDSLLLFLGSAGISGGAMYHSRQHAKLVLDKDDPDLERKLNQETVKGGILSTISMAAGYGIGYLVGSLYQ